MKPQLRRVGESRSPVVVIDDFGCSAAAAEAANSMAPFPPGGRRLYPGLRRVITEADEQAFAYVERVCSEAAQFIAGAFDVDGFDLLEASFSMVTTSPQQLQILQRLPHFDSTDPNYLALLHYLRVPAGTGTAFFRQRSTGIEEVREATVADFIRTVHEEGARLPQDSGYVYGSNEFFEQIDCVEALADRLLIYRGSLLHSGIIPPDMPLSDSPAHGRLTANIFVRAY